jgi:hypothetical protein
VDRSPDQAVLQGRVRRRQQDRDLLFGQLIRDGLKATNRARVRLPGARGRQIRDRADGRGGDLIQGGADGGAEVMTGPTESGR